MARLPRTPEQRQALMAKAMLPVGSGSGRTSVVTPEPRPLRELQTRVAPVGGRFASYVIAPSDAMARSKQGADLVLPGTSDVAALAAACSLVQADSPNGGLIVVLEGNVYLDDVVNGQSCSMAGMGGMRGSTIFHLTPPSAGVEMLKNFEALADFEVTANTGALNDVTLLKADRMSGLRANLIQGSGTGLIVMRSYSLTTIISDCYLSILNDDWTAVRLTGGMLANTRIQGTSTAVGGTGGVGVYVDDTGTVVSGCYIDGCVNAGIIIDADDNTIVGNHITLCGDATHDGIQVLGDRNNVQANLVRRIWNGTTVGTRYGINVLAGATDNLVTNSDLKNSGATASFNDAGTGTITAAGNRT